MSVPPPNARTKLTFKHLALFLSVLCLCPLPQQKPVEPSLNVCPPPPADLLSRSLTFSPVLIPLTMHVPKTELIFILDTPPAPCPQLRPKPGLRSLFKATVLPPLLPHLQPHPHDPVDLYRNLGACTREVPTNSLAPC
ncbi:hypothetical protein DPEC_G00355050 [Dallia pectoralis]|uniref:Uncharacterized protein n=1 Tax=Dallia pectoralis TaxID=75939 RepID=A0ACC2EZE1_DALPE|nr:hypothetical protein DPEC_G00355050 [Dallia pectoralis]